MNERYALTAELADLTSEFKVDRIEYAFFEKEQYEPTGQIPVIRPIGGQRWLSAQRWGLMPYWGKSSLHADRATLGEKRYLLNMLAKKRCVIPCSALLFERREGKKRIAVYRRRHAEKRVFGVAGLFDVWLDSEKQEYPMCTIVTASGYGAEGSMPLILEGEAMDKWLDPAYNRLESVRELLLSIPEPEYRTEPVLP
ncbi:SOS response-associated peptidase family protein [Cohnella pontilimi]|nr:SOS response-associated peptidase family protein [Cohnella pontilimi]